MKHFLFLLMLVLVVTMSSGAHTHAQEFTAECEPLNPNATAEARVLLQTLCDLRGNGLAIGQFAAKDAADSIALILGFFYEVEDATGVVPAITGIDFNRGAASLADSLDEVVGYTVDMWQQFGMVSILSWHVNNPCGGDDRTPLHHVIDVLPGGQCREAYLEELAIVRTGLERIEEAGVPVMLRPYHEMNGYWFWWGGLTRDNYTLLWLDFQEQLAGINNILWMYTASFGEAEVPGFYTQYVGNEHVDIVALDWYSACNPQGCDFSNLNTYGSYDDVIATGKPIVIAEFGFIPPDASHRFTVQGADWLQFADVMRDQYPAVSALMVWNWAYALTWPMYANAHELMTHEHIVTAEAFGAPIRAASASE